MNLHCRCVCGDLGLVLLASLGLSLGLAGQSTGQCTNDVGSGDLPEGEACPVDEYIDEFNAGCNVTPPVFMDVPPLSDGVTNTPITYCGTASNHDNTTTCDTAEDCAQDCDTDDDCPVGDSCVDGLCVGPGQPDCVEGLCDGRDEPRINRRDTDWYLISQTGLAQADLDGNGVVQITSDVEAEFNAVTFLITIDNLNDCNAEVLNHIGCWDADGGGGHAKGAGHGTQAKEVIVVADNPSGIVVFVSVGQCSGAGIFNGFECSTGLNDYLLTIAASSTFEDGTFLACSGDDPNQLGCDVANPGVGGCTDPNCCKLVCENFAPQCCLGAAGGWIQQCANAAISFGCAIEPHFDCMATGPDSTADGYLAICPDPYGSWSSDTFCGPSCGGAGDTLWGDDYNPIGNLTNAEASFTNGLFFFQRDDMGNGVARELLSNIIDWQDVLEPDDSVDRALIAPHELGSDAFDTNGDGVYDRFESSFELTGSGLNLAFELTQEIEQLVNVSLFTQTYVITNNGPDSIDFSLLRSMDLDLVWVGDFHDDSVGTGTNGTGCDRHVFQTEAGLSSTAITVSSPQGDIYFGAKDDFSPPDLWNEYGVPRAWENFITGVGANVNGESGPEPAGDASVGLEIPVTGLAPGASTTVVVNITYGAPTPGGVICEPCPWDCGGDKDGDVGIVDFLELLAQWTQVGSSCDFNGSGVGIVDFLKLLANWGACP